MIMAASGVKGAQPIFGPQLTDASRHVAVHELLVDWDIILLFKRGALARYVQRWAERHERHAEQVVDTDAIPVIHGDDESDERQLNGRHALGSQQWHLLVRPRDGRGTTDRAHTLHWHVDRHCAGVELGVPLLRFDVLDRRDGRVSIVGEEAGWVGEEDAVRIRATSHIHIHEIRELEMGDADEWGA